MEHRTSPTLSIDRDRLLGRIEALAEIGPIRGPHGDRGTSRLALTDADRDGRDLVVTWMRDLGLEVSIDRIGNVFATRAGSDRSLAPVMTGSHIDTVATGGRFDGNLGVLAGLEVIESLVSRQITTRRGITVAFFTNEEGARFPPDMLGSLVYVGGLGVEHALDIAAVDDGARLGDELERIGYAGSTPVPGAAFPAMFVELHIEQGPLLEESGITIGVVEGVQGISWTEFTIVGRSAHAGTTPLRLRRDPLVVAARIAAFARDLAHEIGGDQVATVGRFEVHPNLINVLPASVTLTVDLRNTDDEVLQQAEQRIHREMQSVAEAEGVDVSHRCLARFAPVAFDRSVIDDVERAAEALGYTHQRMPSGAGHDAQMLARVCPAAMIFTPSRDGLSHNPAEDTSGSDIEAAANVLLHVLLEAANRP